MKVFKILFLLLITVLVPLNAQVTYFTNVSDKQIKTLKWRLPARCSPIHSLNWAVKTVSKLISMLLIRASGDTPIIWFIATPIDAIESFPDWVWMVSKGARSRISPMRWVLRCNTPTTDYFSQTMTFNRRSRGIMPCKYITRMIPPRSYLPHAFLFSSRWLVSPLRWAEIRISIPISHTNKSALRSITEFPHHLSSDRLENLGLSE